MKNKILLGVVISLYGIYIYTCTHLIYISHVKEHPQQKREKINKRKRKTTLPFLPHSLLVLYYSSSMASTSKTEEKEKTKVSAELSLWFSVPFEKNKMTSKSSITEEETPQEEARHSGILQEPKSKEDLWKIKKALTKSDINSSCRLLLAKVAVEEQILTLMDENCASDCRTKEGRRFAVLDIDTNTTHQLELKLWSSNSFVMTSNWKKEFVNRRGLEEGDEIRLGYDESRFYFSLLKKRV